jgi:Uma2 family endonuclease
MADLGAFDDMKVELEHGEIVRMNPAYAPHGAAVARVIMALGQAVGGSGLTVSGEAGIVLSDDTVFAFDAALVRGAVPDGRYRPAALALVIEIAVTSLDRDLGSKLAEYARAGIPLYWVVDVDAKVTHVMSGPGDEGYATRGVVRFGESLELPDELGRILLD